MIALWLVVLGVFALQAQAAVMETIEQTTAGWCSPAVGHAGRDVTIICQGVDPKALQRLQELLDIKDLALHEKIREAKELTSKYNELSQYVAKGSQDSAPAQQAKALLEEGKLEEAGKILFAEAYNMAGYHRENRNYAQAITNYKQAIQINPDDFRAYYNLADSYQKMGQPEEALQSFEKALKISPNDARTHYNMANLYYQKGETNQAKIHYKKVIELEPENADLSHRARKNLKVLGE
jgi:tetratricopeptide (TPR) repeat protein